MRPNTQALQNLWRAALDLLSPARARRDTSAIPPRRASQGVVTSTHSTHVEPDEIAKTKAKP